MKKPEYSQINEGAFDFLAERYGKKNSSNLNYKKFSRLIQDNFDNHSILEIGVGSGDAVKYFSGKKFKTTGIDISSKIIEVAREKSPNTQFIHSDFLKYNFDNQTFSGVFANSVLQLFSRQKIPEVFEKIYSILEKEEIFYLSIPLFEKSKEEIIQRGEKTNEILEFRVRYSKKEFNQIIFNSTFNLLEQSLTKFRDSQGNILNRLNAFLVK
ncbi:hypothetical protein COU58_01085 [Candidatus Pacearchaeota archaeon CG10_big_fil_rev_8_21_14_0_10_32_42]|nr:MAG: hypothetical protein COU58_01085 [Candidatus Pacearchaeota archaeon CG10_big_fil_rev_8_21_14_0_10_32_42]